LSSQESNLPSVMASMEGSVDIGGTFGAAYIGSMISMGLYGLTSLQSYLYYAYYPKDSSSLKLLVAILWALESLQVALVCHAMYYYLVVNYANPSALGAGVWSLYASLLCNLIISSIAQSFFAIRVHILSRKYWLTLCIFFFIVAHIAFGLETVTEMFIYKDLNKLPLITFTAALPFAVTAVIPDVLVTICLCYFLNNGRSGFRGTNALINQLIIYAINRCLLTSIVAIIEVILFAVLPGSFFFLAVDFCIGKLYANSLLATLNTRKNLRGRGFDEETTGLSKTTGTSFRVSNSHTQPHSHTLSDSSSRAHRFSHRGQSLSVHLPSLNSAFPSSFETSGAGTESSFERDQLAKALQTPEPISFAVSPGIAYSTDDVEIHELDFSPTYPDKSHSEFS